MYKNISSIGEGVNEYFHKITKLYLSNNKLKSLAGIEVFPFLTHLSVSFNDLETVEEFKKINNKFNLNSLSVKGNLFCKNPICNMILIQTFTNLKDLDGYKISEKTFSVFEGNLMLKVRKQTFKIQNYTIFLFD